MITVTYQLTCDRCDTPYPANLLETIDRSLLKRAALAAGWFVNAASRGRARHYCPDCRKVERTSSIPACPSEAAYRRHLRRKEQCDPCRAHMRKVEAQRRALHPEWQDHSRRRSTVPR